MVETVYIVTMIKAFFGTNDYCFFAESIEIWLEKVYNIGNINTDCNKYGIVEYKCYN